MATKVQHSTVCDVHDDEHDATETVRFAVNGKSYVIDMCDEAAAGFASDMYDYTTLARPDGTQPARTRTAKAAGPDPKAVRAWAQERGIAVSARGRIAGEVLAQYEAAA